MTKAEFVRIALRYDTAMSRAMLRACGYVAPEPMPDPGAKVSVERYGGILECFANRESIMDGRVV